MRFTLKQRAMDALKILKDEKILNKFLDSGNLNLNERIQLLSVKVQLLMNKFESIRSDNANSGNSNTSRNNTALECTIQTIIDNRLELSNLYLIKSELELSFVELDLLEDFLNTQSTPNTNTLIKIIELKINIETQRNRLNRVNQLHLKLNKIRGVG